MTSANSPSPEYNWVYRELVTGQDDLVGALAYVLYKQQKIQFIETVKTETGSEPTDSDWKSFHRLTNSSECITGYLERADSLFADVIESALELKLELAEKNAVTILEDKAKALVLGVSTKLDSTTTLLNGKADDIKNELMAQKGWLQWLRDIFGNILINIATVIVIGAIAIGTNWLTNLTNYVQKNVDTVNTANKPTS